MDGATEVSEAQKFLKSQSVNFKTLRQTNTGETFIQQIDPYWNGAIPITIIYSNDGRIAYKFLKPINFTELNAKLEELEKI